MADGTHTHSSPFLLQIYSVRTQSRAVHIFHTLSSIIYVASETTPTLVTSILLPALPQFIVGLCDEYNYAASVFL